MPPEGSADAGQKGKKQKSRPFDMSKYERRHIALRYSYLGQGYQGLAVQDHTVDTVEGRLFEALRKVRLICDDEKVPLGYSRCGRTDRGVSALGQVSAMMLRSNRSAEHPDKAELDYVGMLNRVLPEDIRAIAWADVPESFSARFTCSGRVYKYFFLKGGKDIERMRAAAAHLVGEHDFRNFAKLDVVNVSNFVRRIYSVTIAPAAEELSSCVYVITVVGTAFLYHQVRCMVAVLFGVGDGHESPEVVPSLLDVGQCPSRPSYNMASDRGLVLWDCLFPSVRWTTTHDAHGKLLQHFSQQFEQSLLTPMIQGHIHQHLTSVESLRFVSDTGSLLGDGGAVSWDALPRSAHDEAQDARVAKHKPAPYVPLMERPRETTYEEKISGLGGSKKARHEANIAKGLKRTRDDVDDGDSDAEGGDAKRTAHLERTELTDTDLRQYA